MFHGTHGEAKKQLVSWVCSSTIWVSGIKLRSPGLVASTFTHRVSPLDQIQRWFRAWSRKDAGCT